MNVLGIDPALCNFGFARFQLDIESLELTFPHLELISTKSGATKVVRVNSDDLDRCRILQSGLSRNLNGINMVFVEVPVGSQSARAMMSYGACVGLLSWIRTPLIQLSPAEVKMAATGSKTASKEDMIGWAVEKYPQAKWLRRGGKLTAANEHLADAIATVHAGIKTDQFQQAREILKWV